MKNYFLDKKGSVAFVGIFIITAVLMIVVVTMSEGNFISATKQVNLEASKTSYYGAEACLEEAMIRLKKDPSFLNSTLTVNDSYTCEIIVSDNLLGINVVHGNYQKNFIAEVNVVESHQAVNVGLLNWEEI